MPYNKILLLFLMFSLFSCGGSQSVGENIENNNNISNLNENQASQPVINPNIKFYMTFDVLGGVFRKNNQAADSVTLANKSISVTHVPEEEPQQSATPPNHGLVSEPFEIDTSKRYNGLDGEGLLTLSIFGDGEEIHPVNDTKDVVRHFSTLTLRFVFHDFTFNNPCLGKVKLKGEIHCEVQGDYEMQTENFLGEAHCTNGPKGGPNPVLYKIPQRDYSIEFDAGLRIDGNPYQYRSYKYDGEITIDGETMLIQDSVTKGASC